MRSVRSRGQLAWRLVPLNILFALVLVAGSPLGAQEPAAAAAPAWNIYFGDLHQHTNLSDGDVVPEELLRRVRSSGVLDFMALSDHSQYFDSPEDWTKSQEWAEVKRLADVHTEPGKFVVLAAFEWSKNSREGGSGHINTFGTDWYASADAKVWKTDVKSYYQKLADDPRAFAMFNHPGMNQYNGFADFSPAFDPRVTLFEIATRSNRKQGGKPRLEAYLAALDMGWHLAPADNTDSHKGYWWIDNCFGRTAVLAKDLSREAILDALRARRAYATYDRNLRVLFTANGQPMGSILGQPASLDIAIDISDPDAADTLRTVEILGEAGKVLATRAFDSANASWKLPLDPTLRYAFLRITQQDGDLAFSAPIWTK